MSRARLVGPIPPPAIRFVVRIAETGTGRTAAEFECDTQLQAEQGATAGLRVLPVGRDHMLFAELTAEMRDSSGRSLPVAHAARSAGKRGSWWMTKWPVGGRAGLADPAEVAPSRPGGMSRVPESTGDSPEPGGDSLPTELRGRQLRTTSDILRMRRGSRS